MPSLKSIPLAPPRLPLLPDPLRRCRVPSDLDAVTTTGPEVDPAEAGMTAEGVRRIWSATRALYRSGVHPAITLCVRREGKVVLDRAIGHARGNGPSDGRDVAKELATPATPFVIFSAAKAVTAALAHLLDERGAFHVGDRVCEYIPEFAKHGKEAITIAHVLSHRAGVPNIPSSLLDIENLGNRELLVQALVDAEPRSRPGKLLAYHAISGGFIIGEIVERVTGKSIRQVLAEEILDPLGFRWGNYGVAPEDVDQVGLNYATGVPPLPPLSTALTRALGRHPDEVTRISNDPRFLTGIIPAGNVVTTANELSRFFDLLRAGGELDGVRIMQARTIRRAIVETSYREIDWTLGAPLRTGMGFMLGAELLSLYGPDTEMAFGHLGFTNVMGWADPERAISVGLITSGKPIVHHGLPLLWGLTRRIGTEAPKV
jgi:CubicO group peptidase (beta-lactamase class C family)